ncbi:hypothetical protein I4F81_002032 [Pyropia yezoensis]|uniref:Uncharacterized protein n=1 Tax=Pyropia yezoensis TaxID=2788 RepID=A0ACC3BNW1_PYRYE|nr:hypothetical protein I4F81_002032 [Neopyropia yezoensis]
MCAPARRRRARCGFLQGRDPPIPAAHHRLIVAALLPTPHPRGRRRAAFSGSWTAVGAASIAPPRLPRNATTRTLTTRTVGRPRPPLPTTSTCRRRSGSAPATAGCRPTDPQGGLEAWARPPAVALPVRRRCSGLVATTTTDAATTSATTRIRGRPHCRRRRRRPRRRSLREARPRRPTPAGATLTTALAALTGDTCGTRRASSPRNMGTQRGWTSEDLEVLCKGFLAVSNDPIKGTDQRSAEFWAAVSEAYDEAVLGNADYVARTVKKVKKVMDKAKKGVSAFASSWLAVQRMGLTGNPDEAAMILGALAHSKGQPVYAAIQAHQRRIDGTATAADKRKHYHLEKWVPCWRVMRGYDKWSGAAGAFACGLSSGESSDSDSEDDDDSADVGDSGSGSGRGAGAASATAGGVTVGAGGAAGIGAAGGAVGAGRASGAGKSPRAGRPFERRPMGIKAAKRQKAEELIMSREMKASTAALEAIFNAFKERSSILLFNLPEMRFTEEAKMFRQAKARAALAAAGITMDKSAPAAVAAATPAGPAVYKIEDDEWELWQY